MNNIGISIGKENSTVIEAHCKKGVRQMTTENIPALVIIGAVFAALSSTALSGQDKYSVKVPNGLAFSEFRGYEAWQVVSVSQDGPLMAAILANPVMIDAYQAGVPGNDGTGHAA